MARLCPGRAAPSGKKISRAYGLHCFPPPAWWLRHFPSGSFSRQRGSGRTVPGYGHRYRRGPGWVGSLVRPASGLCGDDHGPAAAVEAVNYEKHLLHRILGVALHTQIVNDKQVVLTKAGDKGDPVLVEHFRQAVQNGGKIRHQQMTGLWGENPSFLIRIFENAVRSPIKRR